jgi:hypothetical protein
LWNSRDLGPPKDSKSHLSHLFCFSTSISLYLVSTLLVEADLVQSLALSDSKFSIFSLMILIVSFSDFNSFTRILMSLFSLEMTCL